MVKLFLVNILPTLDRQAGNKFLVEFDVCKPNLTTPEYFILSLYSILLTCVTCKGASKKQKFSNDHSNTTNVSYIFAPDEH
jgi:hypothetical protein